MNCGGHCTLRATEYSMVLHAVFPRARLRPGDCSVGKRCGRGYGGLLGLAAVVTLLAARQLAPELVSLQIRNMPLSVVPMQQVQSTPWGCGGVRAVKR